ncbi:MAG: PTS sugar transporter subunit IIA [Candidatus Edwardsbacteria bacterium]
MKIREILSEDCIKLPLISKNKNEVLEELVNILIKAGKITEKTALLDSAIEREGLMSTGIGKSVAIPHGRTEAIEKMVSSFGISKEKIEFGSLDGEPVQIFFFLATPADIISEHVRALALISRMLNKDKVREVLLKAKNSSEVIKILEEGEKEF